MKRSYKSSLMLVLLAINACSNLPTDAELQSIDFMQPQSFLEGAEFKLLKEREGCSLKGIGYGETGQNQYQFYFNHTGLTAASYTSYRYQGSIYDVDSDADMIKVEEVAYGKNSEEDESILELFNELTKRITADNLSSCHQ